jgi:nitrite reductase/ring-hydroxylating ferredoxin subunit
VEPAAEDPGAWSCAADTLAPGQTAKFRLFRRGKPVEAFIINTGGGYHAYINRCPHAGTPASASRVPAPARASIAFPWKRTGHR